MECAQAFLRQANFGLSHLSPYVTVAIKGRDELICKFVKHDDEHEGAQVVSPVSHFYFAFLRVVL